VAEHSTTNGPQKTKETDGSEISVKITVKEKVKATHQEMVQYSEQQAYTVQAACLSCVSPTGTTESNDIKPVLE